MISPAKGDADASSLGSSLAARLVSVPYLTAPDVAQSRLNDWFGDIAPEQAASFRDLFGRFPQRQHHFRRYR